ncbi:hypothetical protein SAMN05216428_1179 [Nitrosospira sp. Nsp11]|uniref:hypothetical protein n=1 Tax=Nitrosospira sp. Nsp11 TaxID=1855338 RepID=UPI00091C4C12|nr:hypothetical protein [Nitrosospira sp. Nsp11]SHM20172.1 hypothetical protein SAMN05216428_1179 [Nitrosospira sp. Nsp11]
MKKTETRRNPIDEVDKAFADIQTIFTKALSEPNAVGWLRLIELLKEAAKDKKIIASPEASAFVELSLNLIRESSLGSSADDVIQPLAAEFISKNSSEMSNKRFEKHREIETWVISEWIKHKAEYSNNKSAFARDYAKRILHEHDLRVQERTIRERWLKGL